MKAINTNYVMVEPIEKPKTEGFTKVEVQDDFVYRAQVVQVPEAPTYVDNHRMAVGDVILFAKYSPDTHEVEQEGKKVKFVLVRDILSII